MGVQAYGIAQDIRRATNVANVLQPLAVTTFTTRPGGFARGNLHCPVASVMRSRVASQPFVRVVDGAL